MSKAKLRALFVLLADDPGGAERVACVLASELAADPAWEVEVFSATRRKSPPFLEGLLPPQVKVSFARGLSLTEALLAIPPRVVGRSYDIVYSTNTVSNALLGVMRTLRLFRTRRLAARESTVPLDRFTGLKAAIYRVLYALYGKQDLIVAQTTTMAQGLRATLRPRSAEKVRVLPNPLDLAGIEERAREPLDEPTRSALANAVNIIFCGRLIEVKQPVLALEAFAEAAMRGDRPVRLVFVGEGPLEGAVRERAESLGLTDRVFFAGRRSNPHAVMAACQYGLLTSSREGYPNVVLEMLACGVRRVVVTPCAGDLELLEGVDVVSGGAAQLGTALASAVGADEEVGERWKTQLKTRSASSVLDSILGIS